MPEKIQSTTEPCAFCDDSAIEVDSGASGLVVGMVDDEPMCIEIVVSVSSQAARNGSHLPE